MKNSLPQKGYPLHSRIIFVLFLAFFMLAAGASAFAQTAPRHKRTALPDSLKAKMAHPPATALRKPVKTPAKKRGPVALTQEEKTKRLKALNDTISMHRAAALANHKTQPAGNISYKVISTGPNTWGYDVYNNGRIVIHQVIIPAVRGRNSFRSKEDAEKVAALVTGKMKSGKTMAVSARDIQTLNIAVK